MREALKSLSCVPDIDARRGQLETAETRLQNLVSPMLLEAFANHDEGLHDERLHMTNYFAGLSYS